MAPLRIALLTLVILAAPAGAQGFQPLGPLEQRLIAALGAGIGEPGGPAGPIDRRLKLAACPATVAIEPPALGAVTLRCVPLGWRIRVPVQRLAMAAATPAVRAEPVVRRGDPIELVAENPGFTVSTQAIADGDGAPGERIRVRPAGKAAPLYAEVIEAGRVRLPGY